MKHLFKAKDVYKVVATILATIIMIGALGAAVALVGNTELEPREIVEKSMKIAADLCVYTNHHVTIETFE